MFQPLSASVPVADIRQGAEYFPAKIFLLPITNVRNKGDLFPSPQGKHAPNTLMSIIGVMLIE